MRYQSILRFGGGRRFKVTVRGGRRLQLLLQSRPPGASLDSEDIVGIQEWLLLVR